jgi:hypothetical protein
LDVSGTVYAVGENHFSTASFTDPHPGTGYAIKIGSGGLAVNGNAVFPTGKVSIGNTNSAFKLEVYTPTLNDGLKISSPASVLQLHPGTLAQGSYNDISQPGDAGIIYGSTSGTINLGLVIAPWSAVQGGIRMDKFGNVGIGTPDTKGYQLAVNGAGVFTKVVVKTYGSWPDYVFEKGYDLPSLHDVENYIRLNNHLPEIPSAAIMAGNGVDLGVNQAALLKKIEELTLYLIDQNKELERVKTDNCELQDQVRLLQSQQQRIERLERLIGSKGGK